MRYVAGQPVERIFPGAVNQPLPPGAALPTTGALRVMVWNIFKQQRADWLSVLKNHGKDAQLVLLQEAQTTPELVSYATANYLAADQVPAFVLPQHPSGVMTLAAAHPVYCCPLREREPLLRLDGGKHSCGELQPGSRRLQQAAGADWRADRQPSGAGDHGGGLQRLEP